MAPKKKSSAKKTVMDKSLRDLSEEIEAAVLKGLDKVGLNKKRRKKAAKAIHRRVLKVVGDLSAIGADASAWGGRKLKQAEKSLQKKAASAQRKTPPSRTTKKKTTRRKRKKTARKRPAKRKTKAATRKRR